MGFDLSTAKPVVEQINTTDTGAPINIQGDFNQEDINQINSEINNRPKNIFDINSAVPVKQEETTKYADIPKKSISDKVMDILSGTFKSMNETIPKSGDVAETALTLGSGVVSALGGGINYLGTLAATKGDQEAAKKVQEATQEALQYNPKTDSADRMATFVSDVFENTGKAINAPLSAIKGVKTAISEGDIKKGIEAYEQGQEQGVGGNLGEAFSNQAKIGGLPEEAQATAYALGKTLPEALLWAAPLPKALKPVEDLHQREIPKTLKAQEELAKVVQPRSKDIQRANDIKSANVALTEVPLTVKDTPITASQKMDALEKQLAIKADEIYSKDSNLYKLSDTSIPQKVGNKTVSTNHVSSALIDMKNYYDSIGDKVNAERISQLSDTALNKGITAKQLNDIAVEHNKVASGYSKLGDALDPSNKKRLALTRQGVKDTVRGIINNPELKVIDKTRSDLIRTKQRFDDITRRYEAARQKLQDEGIREKIGRLAIASTNKLTFGTPGAILRGGLREIGWVESPAAANINIYEGFSKRVKEFEKIVNDKNIKVRHKIEMLKKFGFIVDEIPASEAGNQEENK